VADDSDRCPRLHGSANQRGCPDSDRDGIADDVDRCATQAEVVNGYQDSDGCPD
jgi:hypothetical protein